MENELIVSIVKNDRKIIIYNADTNEIINESIPQWMINKAIKNDVLLKKCKYFTGKTMWRQVKKNDYLEYKQLGKSIPTIRANRLRDIISNKKGRI